MSHKKQKETKQKKHEMTAAADALFPNMFAIFHKDEKRTNVSDRKKTSVIVGSSLLIFRVFKEQNQAANDQ